MIDILDDSYESNLTEEEHERLLLKSEHAIAPPLSPAAQAVVNAAMKDAYGRPSTYFLHKLACGIRAAAYQVAPARQVLDSCCEHHEQAIRHKLLAIAKEINPQ